MKAVLLSIRPNWCKLIWSGMKTIEVRKNRPTLKTPFKVSDRCCYYLKEKPCNDWARDHDSVPYMGLMASEGGGGVRKA